MARGAVSVARVLALWAAGALLSLCGALGYAELASAFRDREGGDVVYLGRAYGPWAGFLFGWTQLAVVRPGDIAVMAFAFATYARALLEPLPWAVALILVLFSYGGWNEMACVAAEVKQLRESIVRALLLGMAAVAALYLLVNGAFLHALGLGGVAASKAVASDAVSIRLPGAGSRLVAALIVLIVLLGSFVEALLYTAPAVYAFYLATTAAVAVLRRREPGLERPYRVALYPLPLVVFGAVCVFLIQAAAAYRPGVTAASAALVALGLPLYWVTGRQPRRRG